MHIWRPSWLWYWSIHQTFICCPLNRTSVSLQLLASPIEITHFLSAPLSPFRRTVALIVDVVIFTFFHSCSTCWRALAPLIIGERRTLLFLMYMIVLCLTSDLWSWEFQKICHPWFRPAADIRGESVTHVEEPKLPFSIFHALPQDVTWHSCTTLAGVTDISANNGWEFSSLCCQHWFINHYVCISISLLIWQRCSLGQCLLPCVLVCFIIFSHASFAFFWLNQLIHFGWIYQFRTHTQTIAVVLRLHDFFVVNME